SALDYQSQIDYEQMHRRRLDARSRPGSSKRGQLESALTLRVDTMFESVARPNLIKRHYGAGAVVSILTHAGTLAVAAWLTRYVPVKSTTEVTVAFVRPVVPAPPPPPPAPAAGKPVRTKPKTVKPRPTLPRAIVAPKVIPEEKPPEKPPEEAPPEEEEEGVEGGVPGGVIGGVQG